MQKSEKLYIQYGCGWSGPTPQQWMNFDSSPTLRFERLPIIGQFYTKNKARFPENVRYGDIVKGLPLKDNSVHGIYASHVLEHLSYVDCLKALTNTCRVLKPGGFFRLIVPDLRVRVIKYLDQYNNGYDNASHQFMNSTYLGMYKRDRSLLGFIKSWKGNSLHLWMWDFLSMKSALLDAGFERVRNCQYSDCEDTMFRLVEKRDRFIDEDIIELAIEVRKPL